jgi:VCBS repeat-containing protein
VERTEEFVVDGKSFVYIDFAGVTSDAKLAEAIAEIKPVIANHPEKSVFTITNVGAFRFDTNMKEIFTQYLKHNEKYVKAGAVLGFDGIKKTMANVAFRASGRKHFYFAYSKEKAIEWLLDFDAKNPDSA